MSNKMSVEEIRQIVSELGLGIPEPSTLYDTAVLLLSAEVVGTSVRRLVEYTGFTPRFVAARAARFRQQGIWTDQGLNYGAWEEPGGDYAFLMAVLLGDGIATAQ